MMTSINTEHFLMYCFPFRRHKDVVAVASINYDPIVTQAAEMFLSQQKLTKAEVQ